MNPTVVVLHGDQTGEELLEEAIRLLDADVIGFKVDRRDFDLSLERRRETRNQVVLDAAEALRESGYGLKAATITPEGAGDVGSPNAILRKQIDGRVIVRTGRRIPGVRPLAGVHAPISVIRMAVDDAYGAKEWREGHGLDEWAYRTEKISRRTCRIVAEYAFTHAKRIEAKVFGGPKYTVSPVYEGMFKEELDAAAERHPGAVQVPDAKFDVRFAHTPPPGGLILNTYTRLLEKDAAGKMMHDKGLQAEGKMDKAKGEARQALCNRICEQIEAEALLGGNPHGHRLAVGIAIDPRLQLEPVDLVVHDDLWNRVCPDLREHGIHLLDMFVAPRVARIHDVQQQCRFTGLGES